MADRQLNDILTSGEITDIKIGGTGSGNSVPTKTEISDSTEYTPKTTTPTHKEGTVYYDDLRGELKVQGPTVGVEVGVGHMLHEHVINNTGATLLKGKAIQHDGVDAQGNVQVKLAIATDFVNARVFGVIQEDILNGEEGAIVVSGGINVFDTSSLTAGVPAYLSSVVAGELTNTRPDIVTQVGGTTVSDATNGEFIVSIINNLSLPSVFGGLIGQTVGNETYSVTTTSQDIVNYDDADSIVEVVDPLLGTIEISNDGLYNVFFSASISFPSATSTRSITVELYDDTLPAIVFSFVKNIPRDATEDGLSFTYSVRESIGNVLKMRIKASTSISVTFSDIEFGVQSINIV